MLSIEKFHHWNYKAYPHNPDMIVTTDWDEVNLLVSSFLPRVAANHSNSVVGRRDTHTGMVTLKAPQDIIKAAKRELNYLHRRK